MYKFDGRRNTTRRCKFTYDESQQLSYDEDAYRSPESDRNVDWSTALFQARDRIFKYIEQLEYLKQTELREDVTLHCEIGIKSDITLNVYISSEQIVKIVNIRIQKMIKNKRIKKNWSEQDVKILIWLISKYADQKDYYDIQKQLVDQDWIFFSTLIPGVTADSCMFKWLSLKKINLASNHWSQEQSTCLKSIVKEQSKQKKQSKKSIQIKNWRSVSQKLYQMNTSEDKIFRNAKQCRQHWNCYLNPNLKKGPWRPLQDMKLLKKIQENNGSKKWSQIVKDFDGRTQNALKNRYTLIISKEKKSNKGKSQLELIHHYLQRRYVEQFTSVIKDYQSDQNQYKSLSLKSKEQGMNLQQEFQQISPFLEEEKKQIHEKQTATPCATPVKIQKFNFSTFASMSKFSLLRFIEPGVLNKDGSFTKIPDIQALRKSHSEVFMTN